MHGKTHKGQTIFSCNDCEFSANTNQQLDDHMNKHRGTRPFQCSECGLMFAARADLRAHVTRTHKNSSALIQNNSPTTNVNRRPQRRAASLQHPFIRNSTSIDGEDQQQQQQPQQEDDFRCSICQRQFTSARLLDRHTYAVHESYQDRNYQNHPVEDEDDVRDYADDELEEKVKPKEIIKKEENYEDVEEEEDDLAAHVEDIIEGDDEFDLIPTIKSVSSANKKLRKFDQQDELPNKRNRRMLFYISPRESSPSFFQVQSNPSTTKRTILMSLVSMVKLTYTVLSIHFFSFVFQFCLYLVVCFFFLSLYGLYSYLLSSHQRICFVTQILACRNSCSFCFLSLSRFFQR